MSLDNELVDFAMQCPVGLKLNNLADVLKINGNEPGSKNIHFQKTNDGKQILRDMMARHISSDVTRAAKQGFSSPDASWFKGESIDFLKRTLLDGNALIYDLMDRQIINNLISQHIDGQQNRRLLIWSLLNAEATLHHIL